MWWPTSRRTYSRCASSPVSCMPVLSSSSPPESHGVGSSSSDTWTQRIGAPPPRVPAAISSSRAPARSSTVSIARGSESLVRSGEHGAQHLLDLLELLAVADQRRGELNHRVAAVIGAADQAVLIESAREEAAQKPLGLRVVEGLLGLAVLDELDRLEEPGAAYVADDRDVAQALEHAAELGLLLEHVPAEVLALDEVDVGERDRRRDRVSAEGVAVVEDAALGQKRLGQAIGGDHRPHRDRRRGDPLGRRDDVRRVAVALAAKPVAEAAPGADHLIGDQQHLVGVADLAHALEVAVLGRDAATGVLDRLEDHRGDRARVLELDPRGDLLGRPERIAIGGPAV